MKIFSIVALLLTTTAFVSGNSLTGEETFSAGASTALTVKLTNNSDTAIKKLAIEERLIFNDRPVGEIPVTMSGTIAPGLTTTVTIRLAEPKRGLYYVLVWYWSGTCFGVGRFPIKAEVLSPIQVICAIGLQHRIPSLRLARH